MNWFALTVKPQHEKAVAAHLNERSIEGYAPTYRARRFWSDRVKLVDLPLFPGYVFCHFRFEDRLKVISVPGVNSVVGFGGKPSPVSREEVAAIKVMVGSGLPVLPWNYVAVGERVRIRQGTLAGLEGILAREKTVHRVVVNVALLGRAVAVEIDRDYIAPAERRVLSLSQV